MHIDDPPSLRAYLIERLSNMSDANPGALADYIIALLRHEKAAGEMRDFCIKQLEDFLHERTTPFVDSLLARINGVFNSASGEYGNSIREQGRQQSFSDRNFSSGPHSQRGHQRDNRRRSRSPTGNIKNEKDGKNIPFHKSKNRQTMMGQHLSNFHNPRDPTRGSQSNHFPPNSYFKNYHPNKSSSFAPYSQHQEKNCLIISEIPLADCNISRINEYFSQFGSIINIKVDSTSQSAWVQFSTLEEAQKAHECPEAVLGNRFIKVIFDKDVNFAQRKSNKLMNKTGNHLHSDEPTKLNTEHQSRAIAFQKRQETLRAMIEVQKQRQELLERNIANQRQLLAKLEGPNALFGSEREEILKTLRGVAEVISSLQSPIVTGNREAAEPEISKTIDHPNGQFPKINNDMDGSEKEHKPILRGGPKITRAARVSAKKESLTLDLRPTTILLDPVPERVGCDVSSIRKLLDSYGSIKIIEIISSKTDTSRQAATISFARRIDAEKAFNHLPQSANYGEPVILSWVQTGNTHTEDSNAVLTAADETPIFTDNNDNSVISRDMLQ